MSTPLPIPSAIREAHTRRKRTRRWVLGLMRLLEWGLCACFVAWLLLFGIVRLTPMPESWFERSTLSLILQDRDGRFLVERPAQNGRFGAWLPGSRLPARLRLMTMAAEDHRLHEHPGVDVWAVFRAFWSNVKHGERVSGASTLAMQLIRQLRPARRTYTNKIREMYWALVLQYRLGPDGIMREYLNRAPYGNRVQGVHRAALLYFDRPALDLSLAQAAFVAGLPWGPGHLNPFSRRGRRRAQARARRILRRAFDLGWLTASQLQEAIDEPLQIQRRPRRALHAIHFTQRILRHLKRKKSVPAARRLVELKTTLDLALQRKIVTILRSSLGDLGPYGAGTGAVIVLDHRSGEILSYVGSPQYFAQKTRGAIDYTQTPRSPGSTLKPFIYAHAIEKRLYTGASLLSDLARGFLWKQGAYHPRNYDFRLLGPLRMRVALGNSRNIPALRTLARVGVDSMIARLRRLGFQSLTQEADFYGLGLALGAGEVSLMELVRAYGTLARGGHPLKLRWTLEAKDSQGRARSTDTLLPNLFGSGLPPGRNLEKDAAKIIAHILSDPVARLPSFGRYGVLEFPFPVAVKTGTSQAYRDAWMIGFSDRVVVGCWIGNHDRRKMKRLSGARGCGQIFQQVMLAAMETVDPLVSMGGFKPPETWKKVQICPLSGMPRGPGCVGLTEEWFPPHHKTMKTCTFHQQIALDKQNGLRAGPTCKKEQIMTRSFVVVPSAFASWARTLGLRLPPRHYSPHCPKTAQLSTEVSLKIRSPLHHSRYILDPTIPPEYSTLALQVESSEVIPRVIWMADGKKIGHQSWPYTLRWPLKKGRHQFVAMTPDGRSRSAPVVVLVR